MKKVIQLTESQLKSVINKMITEQFKSPFEPQPYSLTNKPAAPAPKPNAPAPKPNAPQAFNDPSWSKKTNVPMKSEFPACILNYGKPEV